MSPLDREILAEKAAIVERHLRRVAEKLPQNAEDLEPATDASDAVILHLEPGSLTTVGSERPKLRANARRATRGRRRRT